MRIAVGVHGRFTAFYMARALQEIGIDVRLFTNYPARIVERYDFPANRSKGYVLHGVAVRVVNRVLRGKLPDHIDAALKRAFGRWLARQTHRRKFDAALCWSGIAEETFKSAAAVKLLNRSAFEIAAQRRLLEEEAERVGKPIALPSQWEIEREHREYALADYIVVPSTGVKRSFEPTAYSAKVVVIPFAVSRERWRATPEAVAARLRRLESRERLRILFVGNVSYQKGFHDIAVVVRQLHQKMEFRFTGAITAECADLVTELTPRARFDGHIPEARLPEAYAWADVLILPSIQDGFGQVLGHAQAAALPFIASENTGGPDVLAMGGQGWIVPIRAPARLQELLLDLNEDRTALLSATQQLRDHPLKRTWQDAARELVAYCRLAQR